jgi:CubicO group peptidase (beta-lactamase class C family)
MATTRKPSERVATAAWQPQYRDGPCPGAAWDECVPEDVALSRPALDALAAHVGGRGCVVRRGALAYAWGDPTLSGDLASARKPIISTLLLCAVQEGKLRGVDDPVADVEPRLRALNGGKDAAITWRHLASQTSGYGWSERPGEAWSYNDYALALYYDALLGGVFKEHGTAVLQSRLARPLGFQDPAHFEAFGPESHRTGRIAMSVRDHARFGLLYLRGGAWHGRQLLRRELLDLALTSVVPADLPATAGVDTPMLPGQLSHGGGKRTSARGPGQYSFNWWLNLPNRDGKPLFPDAPPDTYVAIGLGLTRGLWVIPSLDLIVAWQGANWSEDDKVNPGEPHTPHNVAARLMVEAAVPPRRGQSPSAPA